VRVGRDCSICGESHSVLPQELAVWQVVLLAEAVRVLGDELIVEKVELCEITGGELGRFHFKVTKEACCLEESNHVGGTHIGLPIPRLDSVVFPSVDLGNCDQFL
jgi:hypothetical protein